MQNTDDSSVPYSGFFNRLPGIQFIPDSYFLSSSSPSSPRGLCHHKFSVERRKKKVDFVPSAKKRSIEYGGFYLPSPSLDSSIFVDLPPSFALNSPGGQHCVSLFFSSPFLSPPSSSLGRLLTRREAGGGGDRRELRKSRLRLFFKDAVKKRSLTSPSSFIPSE